MNLSEILTQCRSPSDSVRREGELNIDRMATNNYGGLLVQCAQELADESKSSENRQLCATLIKNMVCHMEKHMNNWPQLSNDMKTTIKNYTLSCLASENKDVRRAAGLAVAGNKLILLVYRYM